MRRILPKNLLRPLQPSLRPVQPTLRRYESSTPSSSAASSSSAPRDKSTTDESRPRLLTLAETPAEMPASMHSMAKTRPQRVVYRRDKFFPDHPRFARDLHSDPELFDLDREVAKRMPFVNEEWFEIWRKRGFFKGDPKVTRTHYIECERAWRSRIRGLEHLLWNREKKKWERSDKTVFFIKRSIEMGYPLDGVKTAQLLTARELFDARPDELTINASEIDQTVLDTLPAFTVDPEEGSVRREIIYDRGIWLLVTKQTKMIPKEGKEEVSQGETAKEEVAKEVVPKEEGAEEEGAEGEVVEEVHQIAEQEQLNLRVDDLVKWSMVDERLASSKKETSEEATLEAAADESQLIDRRPWKENLVAYRIYLPNIVVRLVRNHTPKDQPYDPYLATFRIPTGMTKTDLRSYLKSVYDLDVTFIRTDLYWGKVIRDKRGRKTRQTGALYNYKRAVVGLYEPFHYPDDLDELRALGRATGRGDEYAERRLAAMESVYYTRTNAMMRKRYIQKILKRTSYRYRDKGMNNKGSIARNIFLRKQEREDAIRGVAEELRRRVSSTQ